MQCLLSGPDGLRIVDYWEAPPEFRIPVCKHYDCRPLSLDEAMTAIFKTKRYRKVGDDGAFAVYEFYEES